MAVTPNSVQLLSAPAIISNDADVRSITAAGRVDSFVVRSQDNSTNHFVLTDVTIKFG